METSAGLIPLIRDACPSVCGRSLVNFSLASEDKAVINLKSMAVGSFYLLVVLQLCCFLYCVAGDNLKNGTESVETATT